MTVDQVPDDFTRATRWTPEARASVAQRRKLFRFLLESAFFDTRLLQAEYKALTGSNVSPTQEAQRAGYKGRPWMKGYHQTNMALEHKPKPKRIKRTFHYQRDDKRKFRIDIPADSTPEEWAFIAGIIRGDLLTKPNTL